LKDKDLDGVKSSIEITGKSIPLKLTETPQFVVVAENKTAINTNSKSEFGFIIFPNPASNILNLDWYENLSSKMQEISIINSEGMTVKKIHNFQTNSNINIEDLNTGLYILKLRFDKSTVCRKFLKN